MQNVDDSINKVAFECVTRNCPHLFPDKLRRKLMNSSNDELQQWLRENCSKCQHTRPCPECETVGKHIKRQKVGVILSRLGEQPLDIVQEQMSHLTFQEIVSTCSVNKTLDSNFCKFDSDEFMDENSQKYSFWIRYFKQQPDQFEVIVNRLMRKHKMRNSIPENFFKFCLKHKNFSKQNRARLLQFSKFVNNPEWLQKYLLDLPEEQFPPHIKEKMVGTLLFDNRLEYYPQWLQEYLLHLPEEEFPPDGSTNSKKHLLGRLFNQERFRQYSKWLQVYLLKLPEQNFPQDGTYSKKRGLARLFGISFVKYPEWLQVYLLKLPDKDLPQDGTWSKRFRLAGLFDQYEFGEYPKWLQEYLLELPEQDFPQDDERTKKNMIALLFDNEVFGDYPKWLQVYLLKLPEKDFPQERVSMTIYDSYRGKKYRIAYLLEDNYNFRKYPKWLQEYLLKLPEKDFPPNGPLSKKGRLSSLLDVEFFWLYPERLQKYLLSLPENEFPTDGVRNWKTWSSGQLSKKARVEILLDRITSADMLSEDVKECLRNLSLYYKIRPTFFAF